MVEVHHRRIKAIRSRTCIEDHQAQQGEVVRRYREEEVDQCVVVGPDLECEEDHHRQVLVEDIHLRDAEAAQDRSNGTAHQI
jgi:hypothetical protein